MKQYASPYPRNVVAIVAIAGVAILLGNAPSSLAQSSLAHVRFSTIRLPRFSAIEKPPAMFAQDDPDQEEVASEPPASAVRVSLSDDLLISPIPVDDSNPVLLAVQASNPTEPNELIQAVETMLNLGRVAEAQGYLDTLISAGLDDAQLAALEREQGTAFFLGLYRSHRLSPEANAFGRQVLEAAFAEARAPARIEQLITDLSASDSAVRGRAFGELNDLGEVAVVAMIHVLADDSRSDEHPRLATALYQMGAIAYDPLLGSLAASQPTVRAAALEILGRHRVQRAMSELVFAAAAEKVTAPERQAARNALKSIYGEVPSDNEITEYLRRELDKYMDGAVPGEIDFNNQVNVWTWDSEQNQPVLTQVAPALASAQHAARLAQQVYELAPQDEAVRELYLSTLLEATQRERGLDASITDTPAFEVAQSFGVETVEAVLRHAIAKQHPIAAAAATRILGELGDEGLLTSQDGRPRILVDALRHGDRRLRFAAAMAIMQIDPQSPYAGSNYLADALVYFVRSGGDRRVLIGHSRVEQSQTLAAELGTLGYQCEIAQTGRDVFLKAVNHPDYEIILISDSVNSPESNELVQQLRRDPRTSKLPIGLLARQEYLTRARRIAAGDPLTLAMPWPYESSAVQFTAFQLQDSAGVEFVDAGRRLEQAMQAADALKHLAEDPSLLEMYALREREQAIGNAIYTPQLSTQVASLLGDSGTPYAQRELLDYASQSLMTLQGRQAAVDAFRKAVGARGVLLTSREIQEQYDRYNASADLDRETQQLLGSILDIIEAANRGELNAGKN